MSEGREGGVRGGGAAIDDLPASLAGLEVAITGRLLSMTRPDAIAALEQAGARYIATPGERTALVVYGAGGPPLAEDGRPTRALRIARELAERGLPLKLVPEERWLELVGRAEARAELHRLYTGEQLSRILGVEPARLRAWVRHGLVKPAQVVRRLAFFDYQDVVQARSLALLSRRGVGPRALAASLALLRRWLAAEERPLARLEASLAGALYVRLDDGSWAEPSGQLVLDFEPPEEDALDDAPAAALPAPRAPRVATHAREPLSPPAPFGSAVPADWFEHGVRAEERGLFGEAVRCYAAAEQAGDERCEVRFNRGNALYALARFEEAAAAFHAALAREADYLEAWNNLGNTLAALGRHDDAVAAFRRALSLAPGYADAHYNLAEALFERGDVDDARRHWHAYLGIDPASPSADEVRRRLAASELPSRGD